MVQLFSTLMYQPVLYDETTQESSSPSIPKTNARHLANGIMLIPKSSLPNTSCPQHNFLHMNRYIITSVTVWGSSLTLQGSPGLAPGPAGKSPSASASSSFQRGFVLFAPSNAPFQHHPARISAHRYPFHVRTRMLAGREDLVDIRHLAIRAQQYPT